MVYFPIFDGGMLCPVKATGREADGQAGVACASVAATMHHCLEAHPIPMLDLAAPEAPPRRLG